MFRNRELRNECLIDAAAALLFAAAGFFVRPLAGILLLVLGALLTGLHLLHGMRRYARIAELSESVGRVVHGQDRFLISDSGEGELEILTDEVRKMSARLAEQNDALKEERERLSSAIADMFHQIRTPLTSMNLLVSLLSDPDLPGEKRVRYLRELKSQLSRVQWITETLLKLSKLDADAVRFRPEALSVKELAEEAAEPLRVRMELAGIAFEIEDGGAFLTADRAWTAEALGNILKNCAEHTPEGGKISVTGEESPVFTRITVTDTGSGFAPGDLGRVFERFYRGANAAEDSVGIGLAFAREVMAGQGGTLTAKNAEEGGARFVLTFCKTVL